VRRYAVSLENPFRGYCPEPELTVYRVLNPVRYARSI
jgi:hypothetical protein